MVDDDQLRALGIDPAQIVEARDLRPVLNSTGAEREAVICSITRHRYPDRLAPGDAIPDLRAHELDADGELPLRGLAGDRPLVLLFGSYT